MEVVIKLHEDDIMSCPEIIDTVKELAEKIADSTPASWSAPLPEDFPDGPDEGFFPEPPDLDAAPAEWLADEMAYEADAEEAPAEPEQEAPAEPVAEEGAEIAVSIEEVRAAIAAVNKKHGKEKAKGILQKYGADTLSALDKKYYAAALEDAKGAL